MAKETVSIITGQKGTGKTSLLFELVRQSERPVLLEAWGAKVLLPRREWLKPPCQVNPVTFPGIWSELLAASGSTVFIDELDFYRPDEHAWYFVEKILYYHRNLNLTLYATMKYGKDILPVLRDQVDFWYIGRHADRTLRDFYSDMGVPVDLYETIPAFQFYRYSPTGILPPAILQTKPYEG